MVTKKKYVPQELSDSLEVEQPKFSDFRPIEVPIYPLRMELAQLQKDGFDVIPLDALLLMIHRVVKENKNERTQ